MAISRGLTERTYTDSVREMGTLNLHELSSILENHGFTFDHFITDADTPKPTSVTVFGVPHAWNASDVLTWLGH